jgi:hypothetical protein
MRKKWVTHMTPSEIATASKTTRHVRCCVQDSKVHLRYQHQVAHPAPPVPSFD